MKIITPELVTECKRYYELGHSINTIAYETQLSRSVVERALANKVSVPIKCGICGNDFFPKTMARAKYCSFDCRYEAQKLKQKITSQGELKNVIFDK